MAFEKLAADIGILFTGMQNEPKDAHELVLQLHARLAELKAFGLPLPSDLVELEFALDRELEQNRLRVR